MVHVRCLMIYDELLSCYSCNQFTSLKGNYHENMTFGVKRQMCSYEKDKIYGEANLSEFYLILAKSEL